MLSRIIWAAHETMYEHVSWYRLYMSCKYVYECISWCHFIYYCCALLTLHLLKLCDILPQQMLLVFNWHRVCIYIEVYELYYCMWCLAGRSCLTNLLETFENWTRALDEGYGIDVVYLDYRKAFDSVSHQRLLEKLRGLGINGKLLLWIEDFLVSRTMKVGIRGTFSQLQAVLSGVPQGSVLGPLLFLLFINELPTWIINEMRMFADDTKLWCRIKKKSDGVTLQQDIDYLSKWSNIWQLKFNAEKCKVMHIGHSCATEYYMTEGSVPIKLESVQEGSRHNCVIKFQVITTVHESSSNSATSNSNTEKEFQTSGCERLQSHIQDIHTSTSRILHTGLVPIPRKGYRRSGKSAKSSYQFSSTATEIQLCRQIEGFGSYISERA